MGRRKQAWKIGDVFLVQNADGQFSAGQIVGREADVLNSVTVALFRKRFSEPEEAECAELTEDDAISIVFTTRDLLDSGDWSVIGTRRILIRHDVLPHENLRAKKFVGAKVYGSGIVMKFMDAFFGLAPWDDFHDPRYLERLLLSIDLKPQQLVLKGRRG